MTRSRRNRDAKPAASSSSTSAAPYSAAPYSGEPTTLGARLTTILRFGLPALVTALAVAAPLTPTESAPQGSYVILQLLTLLGLGVWALGQLRDPQRRFIGRSTDLLLAVFLAWFTLSALRMAAAGQARTSINVTWTWLAGGALWMLTRQSIRSPRMQRALIAVQAALAVCIAGYGFYQCTIVMPADRAAFRENPEAVLREAGVEAPEGSALRDQFRNRLESREPLATFALTNSLAGYLLPVLLVGGGLLLQRTPLGSSWRSRATWIAVALVVAACLLLTKSRSAYVATLAGSLLLAAATWMSGRTIGWKLPVGAVVVVALLVVVATATGYLDVQVLSEARKSLGYRWEYWQATFALLDDYPINGCGPGNFQVFYTAYKLPQSSEVIADPHNFPLEIAAAAGWPALLMWLGMLGLWLYEQIRASDSESENSPAGSDDAPSAAGRSPFAATFAGEEDEDADSATVAVVYTGAAIGFLLGGVNALLSGFLLHFALIALVATCGVAVLWGLRPWVDHGSLPVSTLVIAVIGLGINLLAAGSLTFPAVANGWWIGGAVALNAAERHVAPRPAPRWLFGLILASSLPLLGLFFATCYQPVFTSQTNLAFGQNALQRRDLAAGLSYLEQAAVDDPWSSEAWRRLASVHQRLWLATLDNNARRDFEQAALTSLRLDPRSQTLRRELAALFFEAYRELDDRPSLENSLTLYADAARLYPNSAEVRAQYAWVLYVAGNEANCRGEAERGLILDHQNPHEQHKLEKMQIRDFPRGKAVSKQVSARPFGQNARECLEQLLWSSRRPSETD